MLQIMVAFFLKIVQLPWNGPQLLEEILLFMNLKMSLESLRLCSSFLRLLTISLGGGQCLTLDLSFPLLQDYIWALYRPYIVCSLYLTFSLHSKQDWQCWGMFDTWNPIFFSFRNLHLSSTQARISYSNFINCWSTASEYHSVGFAIKR